MRRPSRRTRIPAPKASAPTRLRAFVSKYRIETAGVALIVVVVAFLIAWPLIFGWTIPGGSQSSRQASATGGRTLAPTLVPATRAPVTGPTPVPTFQPAILSEGTVIDMVADRRVNGVAFTSIRQTTDRWSAEYRGDGSWMVRGGDASWLVFEESRGLMPANTAAMNLEAPAGRPQTR